MFDKKKMKLSQENMDTLMIELNRIIENAADSTAENIYNGCIVSNLAYPPNNGFTDEELTAIEKLQNNPFLKSALRKIIADTCAISLFDFLNLIDGTSDPERNNWTGDGICLVDRNDSFEESDEMLHDSLFDKYCDWREIRNKDWKLDNLD